MLIHLPLVQDLFALFRRTDRIEHIAVALRMDALLKRLDRKAEIHFVGRRIFRDIRQIGTLQRIQEDQKAQDLVIRIAFRPAQKRVILDILGQVDFLRDPEIVHGLPVPVAHPCVFERVEIIEIGRIASDHPAHTHIRIAIRIEQRLLFHFHHKILLYAEQLSHSSTSSDLLRT